MERFIVGTGRCGSTLLSRMLGENPETLSIFELLNGLDPSRRFQAEPMTGHEFADLLSIRVPEIRSYHTVAGFMLNDFGTLPEVGGSFTRDGWCFEVVDMDGRRIDKVLASRLTPEAARQAQQQEAALRNGPRRKTAQAR